MLSPLWISSVRQLLDIVSTWISKINNRVELNFFRTRSALISCLAASLISADNDSNAHVQFSTSSANIYRALGHLRKLDLPPATDRHLDATYSQQMRGIGVCDIFRFAARTRSSATAEIARDAGDVDFSVDDAHSELTFASISLNSIIILWTFSFYVDLVNISETAIPGHSRSSIVVPIDAAYMTSY